MENQKQYPMTQEGYEKLEQELEVHLPFQQVNLILKKYILFVNAYQQAFVFLLSLYQLLPYYFHLVINQYLNVVRPMHNQFIEPTKKYADIIIPEGGSNKVAIVIISIATLLLPPSGIIISAYFFVGSIN
jgi:hypothetical protein